MKTVAHILVMVPNALFRREISALLKEAGYVVDPSRSFGDALRSLKKQAYDILLVEPDFRQAEDEAQLKALCAATDAPVVCILVDQTHGETAGEQGRRAQTAGARDFLHRTARPGASLALGPLLLRKLTQLRLPSASRIAQPPGRAAPVAPRPRPDGTRRGAAQPATPPSPPAPNPGGDRFPIFLVGCSTGGPNALERLLLGLPPGFPGVLVVAQHMGPSATTSFVNRLKKRVALDIQEVQDTAILSPGTCYVAGGGADLVFLRKRNKFAVCSVPADPRLPFHPSVDRMVQSAAETVPDRRLRCVLLTGIGQDGAESMAELARRGVPTAAESEETCVVFGMPARLIDRNPDVAVLPLPKIAPWLSNWLNIAKAPAPSQSVDAARTKLAQLAQRTGRDK